MLKRKKLVFDYSILIITTTLTFMTFTAYRQKKLVKNSLNETKTSVSQGIVAKEEGTLSSVSTELEDSTNELITANSAAGFLPNQVEEKVYEIITYIVKPEDTVEKIASTYNLKTSTITESNKLTSSSTLQVGQTLQFPSSDGVIYHLKAGENLWDLAQLNSTDYDKLLELNNVTSPETLQIGERIFVPDVEIVKSPSSQYEKSKNQYASASYSRGGNVSFYGMKPAQGSISSNFGERWGRQHKGIDIAASSGSNVVAFQSGKVTFSGWNGGYGNLVIIDHGNGYESYYGHNSKNIVKVGDSVQKGDLIAKVGNTGNSTGPHCHFEIRINGKPVNPINYIN